MNKQPEHRRLSDYERRIDGYLNKHEIDLTDPQEAVGSVVVPDFNAWVKAVDNDPDYIAQHEKKLDDELGKDRLF